MDGSRSDGTTIPARRWWEDPWIPAVAVMVALLALSSVPSTDSSVDRESGWLAALPPWVQNALHVPAYAVLGMFVLRAVDDRETRPFRALVVAAVVCVAFAGIDEAWQGRVAGRHSSFADVGLDAAGSALGWSLHRVRAAWSARARS